MSVFQTTTYRPFCPRVGSLRGRKLICRSGLVLFDWFWTFKSTYRNPVVFIRFFIITLLSIIKRGAVHVDGARQIGAIHSGWTVGYYHWITESLPRALAMKDAFPDAIPVLPSLKQYGSYIPSLTRLGFNEILFFAEGKNAIVENPIITECPNKFGTTDPALLKRVRDTVWQALAIEFCAKAFRVVYVSRKKARGRRIVNEDDLLKELVRLGVEIHCFEDLRFDEQVKLMCETRCLISIHGAALTNMVFMPEGGTIIELLPRKHGVFDYNHVRNSFRHDPCYVRLARVFEHHHVAILGEADSPWYAGTHMANIKIDPACVISPISGMAQNDRPS